MIGDEETQKRGLVGNVTDWLQHPFNSSGSAFNWVLWVGLLIVAVFFWQIILLQIQNEV